MIPVLFPEHSVDFGGMGLGGLGDAQQCRVTWQLNGRYELEMSYPVNGWRSDALANRQIVLATAGPDEEPQPFRIYRITKPLLGVRTVYARHIAYDLMGVTCSPFSADSLAQARQMLMNGAVVQSHGFSVESDFDSSTACNPLTPRTVWSMLGGQRGSLLDIYGGEWLFDHFSVTLKRQLGTDRGLLVRYGKNLRTLEQDENLANTWTAVHPYWLSADGTICVTLPEHTVSAGTFDYNRVMVLDLSADFQEQPTVEQLRSRTKEYISSNRVGEPEVALDVEFVPLEQTEEYKDKNILTTVRKGDAVEVEFPTAFDRDTGAPKAFVRTAGRTVETVWLPLEDRYSSIRLGKKRANFVTVLAQTKKELDWVIRKVGR